jgi:hypothetical protein
MKGKRGKKRRATAAGVGSAVKWFNRFLNQSTLSPRQLAAWEKWSADTHNFHRFLVVREVWSRLGTQIALPRPSKAALADDQYDGAMPLSEWIARERRDNA